MAENNKQFKKPHIGIFVSFLCEQYNLDPQEVGAKLLHQFPELKNKEKCANCDASMREYPCSMTYFASELLCEMAGIVRTKIDKYKTFTEANRVHRSEIRGGYTIASQFTIASKLGLVAKIMKRNKEGKLVHDVVNGWCITTRGFDFLAGKPIPARVTVFRKVIQERFDEMVTMQELYKSKGNSMQVEKMRDLSAFIIDSYHTPKLL